MIERELNTKSQIGIIVYDLRGLTREVSDMYRERDIAGRLDDLTFSRLKKTQELRNQKLIDLFLLKDRDEFVKTEISMFPDEEIHPFSTNRITVEIDYAKNHNKNYYIKAELSDLRRRGVSETSLEALNLIGDYKQVEETPEKFLIRTIHELRKIKSARGISNLQRNDSLTNTLDQISFDLVAKRLIAQREFLPQFGLRRRMLEHRGQKIETVRIGFGNMEHEFEWLGQRIG